MGTLRPEVFLWLDQLTQLGSLTNSPAFSAFHLLVSTEVNFPFVLGVGCEYKKYWIDESSVFKSLTTLFIISKEMILNSRTDKLEGPLRFSQTHWGVHFQESLSNTCQILTLCAGSTLPSGSTRFKASFLLSFVKGGGNSQVGVPRRLLWDASGKIVVFLIRKDRLPSLSICPWSSTASCCLPTQDWMLHAQVGK